MHRIFVTCPKHSRLQAGSPFPQTFSLKHETLTWTQPCSKEVTLKETGFPICIGLRKDGKIWSRHKEQIVCVNVLGMFILLMKAHLWSLQASLVRTVVKIKGLLPLWLLTTTLWEEGCCVLASRRWHVWHPSLMTVIPNYPQDMLQSSLSLLSWYANGLSWKHNDCACITKYCYPTGAGSERQMVDAVTSAQHTFSEVWQGGRIIL